MKLRNLTAFVAIWPRKYVVDDSFFANIDITSWSTSFTWREDPWDGWRDVAQDPWVTVDAQEGDCEDYALVVASHFVSRGEPVKILFLWKEGSIAGDHVAVYADETIYTSGDVHKNMSIDDYIEWSEYKHCLVRSL